MSEEEVLWQASSDGYTLTSAAEEFACWHWAQPRRLQWIDRRQGLFRIVDGYRVYRVWFAKKLVQIGVVAT